LLKLPTTFVPTHIDVMNFLHLQQHPLGFMPPPPKKIIYLSGDVLNKSILINTGLTLINSMSESTKKRGSLVILMVQSYFNPLYLVYLGNSRKRNYREIPKAI
jgi:hypothetical protein